MADTDALRPYRQGSPAGLPGSEALLLRKELEHVSQSLNTVIAVMKKLEARMVAHGI